MVVLFHCWLHFGRAPGIAIHAGPFALRLLNPFCIGYGGVDLFFVLSGFCLAYPMLGKPDKAGGWKRYFINRMRRILPPYWACLALLAVSSLMIMRCHLTRLESAHAIDWPGLKWLGYAAFLILPSFNSSFWTLVLEWRWYFVFPLMMRIRRHSSAPALLLIAGLISALSAAGNNVIHSEKIRALITPLPDFLVLFAIGIWLADLYRRSDLRKTTAWLIRIAPLGALVMLVPVAWLGPGLNAIGGHANFARDLVWGPFWLFVLLSVLFRPALNRLASCRPLAWIGTFSYSLYLIHEPIIRVAAAMILPAKWPHDKLVIVQYLGLPLVTIGLAYLFFLAAERPFLIKRPVFTTNKGAEPEGRLRERAAHLGSAGH